MILPLLLFFIGFRAKKVPRAEDLRGWFNGGYVDRVTEICSVSDCIAEPPEGWENRWDFNRAWCYDSEDAALATVPAEQVEHYELFAYRLYGVEFPEGGEPCVCAIEEMLSSSLPQLPDEPDLSSYLRIGYDAGNGSLDQIMGPGCSPLSCNGRAVDCPVNRFCLFEDLSQAVEMTRDFANGGGEPGPYHLFEVLRKRSSHWTI